ncbi:MAG: hypothetical protein KI790_14650 [Cyclobacteriaceae bacterium]|nr:hypothetical protein [Cyclobacteriaceae bacterium HetDA_MAG_MS6]
MKNVNVTYNEEEVKMLMRFAYNKGVIVARNGVKAFRPEEIKDILDDEREKCISEFLPTVN